MGGFCVILGFQRTQTSLKYHPLKTEQSKMKRCGDSMWAEEHLCLCVNCVITETLQNPRQHFRACIQPVLLLLSSCGKARIQNYNGLLSSSCTTGHKDIF